MTINTLIENKLFDLSQENQHDLSGKTLVASPFCKLNEIFNKSVIYIVSHSSNGTIGLIINNYISSQTIGQIIEPLTNKTKLTQKLPILLGGPLATEKSFIMYENLNPKDKPNHYWYNNISVSSDLSILKEDITSININKTILLMGYTGWEKNQLEAEIENNLWIISECNSDVIFSCNHKEKWNLALLNNGIEHQLFVPNNGKC